MSFVIAINVAMKISRTIASRLAAALVLQPHCFLLPGASHAVVSPEFDLPVPSEFVALPPRDATTLLVAGNFRTGTTLSVQRVASSTVRKLAAPGPASSVCDSGAVLCDQTAEWLASSLAAYRDTQAAPSGARSQIMPGTVRVREDKLMFEMLLVLASTVPGAPPDPELSRHTAVAALPCDGGASWLCLWAGAKASNWDASDGALLQRSVEAFTLRR